VTKERIVARSIICVKRSAMTHPHDRLRLDPNGPVCLIRKDGPQGC
jgi:hypothetical protein